MISSSPPPQDEPPLPLPRPNDWGASASAKVSFQESRIKMEMINIITLHLLRKGILLSPPRPGQSRPLVHHPGLLAHGGHGGGVHHVGGGGHHGPGMHGMSEFSSSGPASLPWGGSAPPQRGLVRPIPGRGRGGGDGAAARGGPQKDPGKGKSI